MTWVASTNTREGDWRRVDPALLTLALHSLWIPAHMAFDANPRRCGEHLRL